MTQVPKPDSRRDLISLGGLRRWIGERFNSTEETTGADGENKKGLLDRTFSRRIVLKGSTAAATAVTVSPTSAVPTPETFGSILATFSHHLDNDFAERMFGVWRPLMDVMFKVGNTNKDVCVAIEGAIKADPEAALEGMDILSRIIRLDLGAFETKATDYRRHRGFERFYKAMNSDGVSAEVKEKLLKRKNIKDFLDFVNEKFKVVERSRNKTTDKNDKKKLDRDPRFDSIFRRDILMMIHYFENKLYSDELNNEAANAVVRELEKRNTWLEELEELEQG